MTDATTQADDVLADCPIRGVLSRVSGRWSLLVIVVPSKKAFRFGELQKYTPDISARMFSQTLRHLERDKYVSSKAYATLPSKVEYSITDLGKSFLQPMQGMISWADDHQGAIRASRESYVPPEGYSPK